MSHFQKTTLLGVATILAACQQATPAPKVDSDSFANTVCSNSTTRLMAGQNTNVGNVTVTQDEQFLCVSFVVTAPSWFITEDHLAIATDPALLPQTGSGNPQPGQFPYHHTGLNTQQDTFCVDYLAAGYSAGQTLYVAAHAVVVRRSSSGAVLQRETAWGEGSQFSGRNWAMYFNHTMGVCDQPPVALCQAVPGCPSACEDIDAGSFDPDGPSDIASITCTYNNDGTTATLVVTDSHGLTASCTAEVGLSTCNDAPVAVCQDIQGCPSACEAVNAGSYDPDGQSDIAAITCEYSLDGTTAVLTVTDQAGLTSTCEAHVDLDACNEPPVAVCQDIQGCPSACEDIDVGSYDPDGESDIAAVACEYSEDGTQATLTVTDQAGLSSSCTAAVDLDACNKAPVAVCRDLVTECPISTTSCDVINGGTYDPDGAEDIASITCSYDENGHGTLTVTDLAGLSTSCEATVTVADTSAPVPTVQSMILMAVPRSYELEQFSLASCVAAVTDNCGSVPDINVIGDVVSISADELPDYSNHQQCQDPAYAAVNEQCKDIVIDTHSTFRLRNNKTSGGGGRVYTVRFTVHDDAGNTSPVYSCLFGVRDYATQPAPRKDPDVYTVYP